MKCKTCHETIVGFDINGICEDCVNEEDQEENDICPDCCENMEWCTTCKTWTCFGCSEYGTCECS